MAKTLLLLLFVTVFFSLSAKADSVSLTINNGGSITSGGVYVGPYNFTSGGQSLQLVCDTFQNDVYPPETWTANMTMLGAGTGLFGSTGSTQYQDAGWLVQQMFGSLSNKQTVTDIQWAIWDIFDPGTCNTGVSNCDPYGNPGDHSSIAWWIATAGKSSVGGNYSNVVIYTPQSGWPSNDGIPQEYIGTVPEPSTVSLVLIGLAALGLMLVIPKRISLRHPQATGMDRTTGFPLQAGDQN
jgi:PEP-CTERM motif-containing protein